MFFFFLDGDRFGNVDEVVWVVRNIFEWETPGSNRFVHQMFFSKFNCLLIVFESAALEVLFKHTALARQAYSKIES